ncbi:hypothetical protein Taro_010382 [Colocasia esculenta]|uniref:Uncharacterized protein n=1 Tax=Colocasia esculenta TaxID=4460 RepID=A0A843U7H5_COLES|nr:hypothetical protein [Colocasia esculenta]
MAGADPVWERLGCWACTAAGDGRLGLVAWRLDRMGRVCAVKGLCREATRAVARYAGPCDWLGLVRVDPARADGVMAGRSLAWRFDVEACRGRARSYCAGDPGAAPQPDAMEAGAEATARAIAPIKGTPRAGREILRVGNFSSIVLVAGFYSSNFSFLCLEFSDFFFCVNLAISSMLESDTVELDCSNSSVFCENGLVVLREIDPVIASFLVQRLLEGFQKFT